MRNAALTVAVLLTLATGSRADSFAPGMINADDVNLRSAPSLKAEIVGQLQKGQEVRVIAMDGEWCAIAAPSGIGGWIAAEYFKDGAVTGSRVNVRSGPGIAFTSLGKFEAGDRPEVLEQQDKWVKVALPPGVHLWLNARYVQLGTPVGSQVPAPAARVASPEAISTPSVMEETIVSPVPSPPPPGEEAVASPPPELKLTEGPKEELARERRAEPLPPPLPVASVIPFLPRSAPAYTPTAAALVKNYSGIIRALAQPYQSGKRKITHELVKIAHRWEVIGHLSSPTIDLSRFENRKVALWAEVVVEETEPIPLLDVKGIQIKW